MNLNVLSQKNWTWAFLFRIYIYLFIFFGNQDLCLHYKYDNLEGVWDIELVIIVRGL